MTIDGHSSHPASRRRLLRRNGRSGSTLHSLCPGAAIPQATPPTIASGQTHTSIYSQMLLACKEGTETTPSSRGVTRDFVYGVGVGAPLVLIVVLTIMMGLVVNRSINVEIQAQTSLVAREYDQQLASVNLKLTQAIEREAAVQHRLNAVEALLGTPARVHDDSTQRLVPAPTLSTTSKRSLQEQDGEEGCLSTSEMSRLAVRTAYSVNENHATLAAAMDGKADSLAAEAAEAGRLANGCTASLTDPATTCTPPEDGLVVTGCAVSSGGGTCTVVAHTCATSPSACPLTTELSSLSSAIDGKADASAVVALGVQLADKVDTSTMTDELADKADTSTMASLLAEKADETSIAALQSELDQKADASAVQALGSIVVEDMPCLCAACADFPVGAVLCVPFGSTSPCDCIDSSGSTNPIRQTYPMTQSDPKCCRSEWLRALTLTQARTSSPQEYDQDDVLVKVGGEVTFVMMGFENVEQVYDFVDFLPVTGGIRSGDPANGVTFTHTFDTPGVYFLRSQVHETLQAKVTVMDCVDCIVVAGYDGATLPTLSQALSSRAAGEFALTVSDSGLAQVMTFLTVYQDQTLALTGATLSTGQLAKLDATITLMNGAGLVVDGTYISGGVSMGQQATLQDNTGHVVATTSGLALPMVVPTAAIVSAAIVAVDESTDTVTLSEVDTSIGVGQKLRVVDTDGNTCAVFPKATDLTVQSVDSAIITFSTDITTGDSSASTNCELTRAEVYPMPSCEIGDPPAVIYTRDPHLDMDVLKACSEMDGVAAWRSVLTMGGVIFDSADIPGFIAAIASGLPGKYVLRLIAGASQFAIGSLSLHSHQDVRILLTTPRHLATHDILFTGDIILATPSELAVIASASSITFSGRLNVPQDATASLHASADEVTFEDFVDITTGSSFAITGTIDKLAFPGSLNIATGSTASIESTSDRSISVAMGTPWLAMDPTTNQGSVTFSSVGLLDSGLAVFGDIDGTLPGVLAVDLDANQPGGNGEQSGTVSLGTDGTLIVPSELNAAMGQVFTDVNIEEFEARVNSGGSGMIGLQLSRDNQVFEMGALNIVGGQDVRVFSTTSGSTLRHIGAVRITGGVLTIGGTLSALEFEPSSSVLVESGATLQISGTIGLTDTWLLTFLSRSAGMLALDGGVTMTLPDGTAPTLEGELPGTVVATLSGTSVGSLTRADDGTATGPTNSLGRVDRMFLDTEIAEFVAAVNAGEPGLFALQLTRDTQVFEVGALDVVNGQDVRIFSTTSATVQPASCTTTPVDACATGNSQDVCEAAGSCTWDPSSTPWCAVTDQDTDCSAAVASQSICEAAGAEPGDCTWSDAVQSTLRHTGALSVTGGSLIVAGTLATLEFAHGYPLEVAAGATLRVSGAIALPHSWLLSAALRAEGTVTLDGGMTMPLIDGVVVTLGGGLPGTLTATGDAGATVGTAARDVAGNVALSPSDWLPVVVTIKAWGGGGGGGFPGSATGGAGGFAAADYLAQAGDTLVVTVGNGGQSYTSTVYGGFPNGVAPGSVYSSYEGGGGGGASFVRAYTASTRDATGVVVGAGGGGGSSGGGSSWGYYSGGGGGGGTWDGAIGSRGWGGTSSGSDGTDGNGGGGSTSSSYVGGASDHGGQGGGQQLGQQGGGHANGAGGGAYQGVGGGGGGAASFANVVAGSARTVDAADGSPANTEDPQYQTGQGSGEGRTSTGYRGRVVLLVGGEETTFDTTYTSYASSYSSAILDSNSEDFVVAAY